MALRVVGEKLSGTNPAVTLYRSITKQIPRVLTLYDIGMDPKDARMAVQNLFRANAQVKDPRVVDMLLSKAHMELEETLMQWKQKAHLQLILERALPERTVDGHVLSKEEEAMDRFFADVDGDVDEDDEDEDLFEQQRAKYLSSITNA